MTLQRDSLKVIGVEKRHTCSKEGADVWTNSVKIVFPDTIKKHAKTFKSRWAIGFFVVLACCSYGLSNPVLSGSSAIKALIIVFIKLCECSLLTYSLAQLLTHIFSLYECEDTL